jgi:hypothetical protein
MVISCKKMIRFLTPMRKRDGEGLRCKETRHGSAPVTLYRSQKTKIRILASGFAIDELPPEND